MWVAERLAVNPRTEEDAVMSYYKSVRFMSKVDAKSALLNMIEREIAGWHRMDGAEEAATRDETALRQLRSDDVDSVVVGPVCWQIREFSV